MCWKDRFCEIFYPFPPSGRLGEIGVACLHHTRESLVSFFRGLSWDSASARFSSWLRDRIRDAQGQAGDRFANTADSFTGRLTFFMGSPMARRFRAPFSELVYTPSRIAKTTPPFPLGRRSHTANGNWHGFRRLGFVAGSLLFPPLFFLAMTPNRRTGEADGPLDPFFLVEKEVRLWPRQARRTTHFRDRRKYLRAFLFPPPRGLAFIPARTSTSRHRPPPPLSAPP